MFFISHHGYKSMFFITFVLDSLYPKGNNDPKDEGLLTFNILCCLVLDSWHLRTSPQHWRPPPVNSLPLFLSFEYLRQTSPSSCRRKKFQQQGLPLCSRWTPIRTSFPSGRPEARRGRPLVQRLRRTTWTRRF
jgi:hypothetical protein